MPGTVACLLEKSLTLDPAPRAVSQSIMLAITAEPSREAEGRFSIGICPMCHVHFVRILSRGCTRTIESSWCQIQLTLQGVFLGPKA